MKKINKNKFKDQKFKNIKEYPFLKINEENIAKSVEFVISNENMAKLFENLSKK